jgi:hypothetical protein
VAAAHDAAVRASAQAKQATAAKDEAIVTLVDMMKADLRYAESTTRFDRGKLELLGWGAPKNRTPCTLTLPLRAPPACGAGPLSAPALALSSHAMAPLYKATRETAAAAACVASAAV